MMLVLTIGLFQTDKLGLKADLIKDKKRLAEEHGVHIDVKDLSQFEKYASMNLSGFTVNKKMVNNSNIVKWTSKSNPKVVVFKVETVLAGDTTFTAKSVDPVTKMRSNQYDVIKLKPQNFTYYTYIIVTEKGTQLVYLREKNEGLIKYRVGTKAYEALKEVITLGQNYPDLDNLVKTVLALK